METYIQPKNPSDLKTYSGVAICILFTFIISYGYGVIMAVSPLVYFNFFITAIFGLTLGYGVRIIGKLSYITEKKYLTGTALTSGILGLYLSWVAYTLYFLTNDGLYEAYFENQLLVFNPIQLFDIIQEMNKNGMWQIGSIVFKGWILTIIWIIEAGIIIGAPWVLVKNQPLAPYSATHNKWYKKYILRRDFESIVMKKDFIEELKKTPLQIIDSLGKGSANNFSRISVFYLKGESKQYLTIENVRRSKDGKNENTTEIVHLMVIDNKTCDELISKYHGEKAFFFDY